MAQYTLGRDHYLHHQSRDGVEPRFHAKGERISWDGAPSASMIPVDSDAKKRVEAYNAEKKERHEKLRANGNAPRVGWTPAMESSLLKNLSPEADAQVDSRPTTRTRRQTRQ